MCMSIDWKHNTLQSQGLFLSVFHLLLFVNPKLLQTRFLIECTVLSEAFQGLYSSE